MDSILDEVKKVLGLAADYTAFDVDIIMHINATFGILADLGVGPEGGFFIADNSATWDSLDISDIQLSKVKSFTYLKAKMAFDPPTTSFGINAMEHQIAEFAWRISETREVDLIEEVIP